MNAGFVVVAFAIALYAWGAFTALFASFSVCPFCGSQGCPTGSGIYGGIMAIVYGLLRIRKRKPANNNTGSTLNHVTHGSSTSDDK